MAKQCVARIEHSNGDSERCPNRPQRGKPFCKGHAKTHKLVVHKCTGEAHGDPYIDNCGVCAPFWGKYPVAVPNSEAGEPWDRDRWE